MNAALSRDGVHLSAHEHCLEIEAPDQQIRLVLSDAPIVVIQLGDEKRVQLGYISKDLSIHDVIHELVRGAHRADGAPLEHIEGFLGDIFENIV